MKDLLRHFQSLRRKAKAELKKRKAKQGTLQWDWDGDRDRCNSLEGYIEALSIAIACVKDTMKREAF